MNIGKLILLKNNQLIAFNKLPGIPVQKDLTEDKALIDLAEIYTKAKLFVTHRIDRPSSGIVLFAKNAKSLANLNEQFKNREIKKTYLAVVKNLPTETEGELIHFLQKNAKKNLSYASDSETKNTKNAKKAILNYKHIGSIENYHLLEIELQTGRHHQIRAQLAAIKSPIKGDVKYGARRGNRDRSIHLHAWKMSFQHPVSKETINIVATPPDDSVWNAFKIK